MVLTFVLEDNEFQEVVHVMTGDCGELAPARKAWADRVFNYCDEDTSGYLDLKECNTMRKNAF